MKKYLFAITFVTLLSSCETAKQILDTYGQNTGALTQGQITSGLKEALTIGTQNSTSTLSNIDGFFANAAIKILMPDEAKQVESTLRSFGLGGVVDKAVLSMNRAAEDATKGATDIFIGAIKQMTIQDALGILKGGDFAATNYFKDKTTLALINSFRPTIENALKNTNATKYWKDVFTAYNTFSSKPVNTDLTAYVTGKAVDGIFYQVGLEEQKIRKDPMARVTDILKKVFGSKEAQG